MREQDWELGDKAGGCGVVQASDAAGVEQGLGRGGDRVVGFLSLEAVTAGSTAALTMRPW